MRAPWATALAIPLFIASGGALAGEPGSDDDVVVTGYGTTDTAAAKTVAPLRDLPQSIAVVSAAVLRDQRALSLQDALKNVPGVGFSSGDGQRDQVTIRGFSAIADQYVDGFRDDALYFRDLSNTDRVEVIKGPAAVLYGRGSSGGLINRVLKRPDVDVTSASLTGGSFGRERAEWDVGRYAAASGVGMRLTGAYEDSGSFREQQFLRRVALAPSLLVRGGSTSLYAVADYVRDRRLMDLGIPALNGRPVDVPRGTYYGAANAREADTTESQVLSQTAVVEHAIADGLRFRDGFRHYDYALERHGTLPEAVDAKALTVALRHNRIDRREEGWSNQAELTQTLALAATEHQLLYGYEAARQLKDASTYAHRVVARTALFDPVLPMVDNDSFTKLSARTSTALETQALYLQDLADLGHGVKALVGARHDWFTQRTRQLLPGQPNLARLDRTWSPRGGLVLQPDAAQSYYVSWSRSYQPSAETFALAANNAELAPERTVNREVGAKYTLWGGRLALQGAGFVLRRTGIKGSDPAAPTRLIPIGTQRTRGIELSGQLDLAAGLHAVAGYSYLDARVIAAANPDFAGKRATITPRNAAHLFVTRNAADRFGLGGGLNYVGDRWADAANTTVLPHYVTGDAMAWCRIGAARLQLNGYNLGDKSYIVAGHGTSALLNLPGAPRTVLVTLRLDG